MAAVAQVSARGAGGRPCAGWRSAARRMGHVKCRRGLPVRVPALTACGVCVCVVCVCACVRQGLDAVAQVPAGAVRDLAGMPLSVCVRSRVR